MFASKLFRRPYAVILLAAAVLTAARLFPVFFGQTLFFGDNFSLMVPGKIFSAQWLRQGVLPLWNPYLMSGLPWLADINQSLLYPSTVLFIVFNPAVALNLTIGIHLIISFVGMFGLAQQWMSQQWLGQYKLGQNWPGKQWLDKWLNKPHPNFYSALLAAGMWTLSTQVTASINNLSTLQSLAWLPWVLWLALLIHSRYEAVGWLALVITLQWLGGYPPYVAYSLAAAVILAACQWQLMKVAKRNTSSASITGSNYLTWSWWFFRWLVALLWCVTASALAWLPFWEVLLNSTRLQQSLQQAAAGSLHPLALIKVMLPYFWELPWWGMKWGPAWNGQLSSVWYITWVGLIIVGVSGWWAWFGGDQTQLGTVSLGRQKFQLRCLSLIVLVTTLLSLGNYLPGFSLLQRLIPFFRINRTPNMSQIITTVALVLWLASAWWWVMKSAWLEKWGKLVQRGFGLVVIASLVAAVAVYSNFPLVWSGLDSLTGHRLQKSQFHTLARDHIIIQGIIINLVVASSLAWITWLALRRQKTRLVILCLWIDVFLATQGTLLFGSAKLYPTWPELDSIGNKSLVTHDNLPLAAWWQQNNDRQLYRVLTRNGNTPYSDFASYWEAISLRAPFSDSFVDEREWRELAHPRRLQQGLTPDWQIVQQVPLLHGYTTLVPQDYANVWQTTATSSATPADPAINFIDYIPLTSAELARWSVRYYVVDEWFKVSEDLSQLQAKQAITSSLPARWQIYEFPQALPRIRYENGQPPEQLSLNENPNRLKISFTNANSHDWLIVADCYDRGWQATVNGQPVIVENDQGMRRVRIVPGINQVVMSYSPLTVWAGLSLSGLTSLLALIIFVCLTFAKKLLK